MSQKNVNLKMPIPQRKSVRDLTYLCILLENSAEGLGFKREHYWGHSIYENIPETMLYPPPKSSLNFTSWFMEGHSWSIIVTKLRSVLRLHA